MTALRKTATSLLSLFLLLTFLSCQKEIGYDAKLLEAKGSLQTAGGDCLPKLVGGAYLAGKTLSDSNFLEVTVSVTTPGGYTLSTDSVNGYRFKGSGTFLNTGATKVRLKGLGKPTSLGTDNFKLKFDSSSCNIAVTVLSGTSGSSAAFTLAGAPGGCTAFIMGASIYKDSTLDARHFIKVNVNVSAPGNYTLATNTVNGYSFSASGTFGATGPSQLTLLGSGKPLAVGVDHFTLSSGASSCTFANTVSAAIPPPGGCTAPSVQGTYTAGIATSASNKITFTHTYSSAGSYVVSSDTINGYHFGPLTFTATAGSNTVTLTASGTPVTGVTNAFRMSFGDGTLCPFSITASSGGSSSGSFIPLSLNSWWSYDVYASSSTPEADTLLLTNRSNFTFNNKTYTRVSRFDNSLYDDTMSFAQVGSDYFIHLNPLSGQFLPCDSVLPKLLEATILNPTSPSGTTWNSGNFTEYNSGMPFMVRYQTRIVGGLGTQTVRGVTYNNVITANFVMQVQNQFTGTFSDQFIHSFSFAKDIGIISYIGYFNGQLPFFVFKWELRNYKIN